jgi:hypothetical protein
MTYTVQRFGSTYAGGVALPTTLHPYSETPGPITSPMIELPGRGAWDSLGTGIARPEVQTITHRGKVIAASAVARQTALDALYALRSKRDKLWKSNDGGTTTRWRYARVLDVRAELGITGAYYAIVEMDFELEAALWAGAAYSTTVTLDSATHSVTLPNAGNGIVSDLRIVVKAEGTNITLLSVATTTLPAGAPATAWYHWHFTGAILVAGYVDIYCGSKRVYLTGTGDDFAHFTLQSDHVLSDWLPLYPGNNVFSIGRSGGDNNCSAEFYYNDGWV